jgi:hypothetical protein
MHFCFSGVIYFMLKGLPKIHTELAGTSGVLLQTYHRSCCKWDSVVHLFFVFCFLLLDLFAFKFGRSHAQRRRHCPGFVQEESSDKCVEFCSVVRLTRFLFSSPGFFCVQVCTIACAAEALLPWPCPGGELRQVCRVLRVSFVQWLAHWRHCCPGPACVDWQTSLIK